LAGLRRRPAHRARRSALHTGPAGPQTGPRGLGAGGDARAGGVRRRGASHPKQLFIGAACVYPLDLGAAARDEWRTEAVPQSVAALVSVACPCAAPLPLLPPLPPLLPLSHLAAIRPAVFVAREDLGGQGV
jgi:hypothetical protein